MTVDINVTRMILQEEFEAMENIASNWNWIKAADYDRLVVTVEMQSAIDQQVYIVEARCNDYRAIPPYFEFIDRQSGQRGTSHCYPAGGSYFHPKPCVCVQWNRKAYQTEGGPHGDWPMANWGAAWPGIVLGDMFLLIQLQINKRDVYKGRMA